VINLLLASRCSIQLAHLLTNAAAVAATAAAAVIFS